MMHMCNDGGLVVSTAAFQTADPGGAGQTWSRAVALQTK